MGLSSFFFSFFPLFLSLFFSFFLFSFFLPFLPFLPENHLHDLPGQLCRKWPIFAVKRSYAGVYVATFFKGFSTTRVKKNLPSAPAVILFFQEILWHFLNIGEEDRRFRANLFLLKNFLRHSPCSRF